MWSYIAALSLLVIGAQAHALAVSHSGRVDGHHHAWGHNIHHGHHGHGWAHSWGHHGHGNWGNGWGHGGWGNAAWVVPVWGHQVHHGHLAHHGLAHDAWAYPAYKFAYSVSDPHTGDHKSQSEVRHGDVVHGAYSLVEPDGNLRSVHYSADDHRGFNAIVHHATAHHHAPIYGHHLHH